MNDCLFKIILAFLFVIFRISLIVSFKLCSLWFKLRYNATIPKEWLEDAKKHVSLDKIIRHI